MTRHAIDPDPVWDAFDVEDGVLVVELSWAPDALAGRAPELVAVPELVSAMRAAGLTGFRTDAARATYDPDAFDVAEGEAPPPLVRVVVGDDPDADLSYGPEGLTVTGRALAVLREHCRRLQVGEDGPS